MYALMAKCEELSASMAPIYKLHDQMYLFRCCHVVITFSDTVSLALGKEHCFNSPQMIPSCRETTSCVCLTLLQLTGSGVESLLLWRPLALLIFDPPRPGSCSYSCLSDLYSATENATSTHHSCLYHPYSWLCQHWTHDIFWQLALPKFTAMLAWAHTVEIN